jgi:hypothetical protein
VGYALLAALALAPANPADGVECVYRVMDRPTLHAVAEIMQPGHEDDPPPLDRMRAAASVCAKRLGWSDPHAWDSAVYAMARAGYEETVATLQSWGVRTPVIDQVVAVLTPEQKAQVLAGKTGFLGPLSERFMGESEIIKLPRQRRAAAADLVGAGIVSALTRDDVVAGFDH